MQSIKNICLNIILVILSKIWIKTDLLKEIKMCDSERPDAKEFLDNLKMPMSLKKKIYYFLKNNAIKIVRLKSCCGHPGEPGC
ncbi:MAG: hypothetical protein A2Y97_06115 [Nitrospirae bacterium RBG_13_39_12]|nr:MAG: hypothetical protein A2Y97_06115 [Nitrospirae bacterium RBG_13_39_12]